MGEMEQICFQIISCSGTAKSMYVEAIQKAKANDYVGAKQLMEEAENIFVDAHHVHATLIQKEASGEKNRVFITVNACRRSNGFM